MGKYDIRPTSLRKAESSSRIHHLTIMHTHPLPKVVVMNFFIFIYRYMYAMSDLQFFGDSAQS